MLFFVISRICNHHAWEDLTDSSPGKLNAETDQIMQWWRLLELEEELGINATIGEEVRRIQHEYPNGGMVELRFFLVREYEGEIENRIFKDVHWSPPQDLPKYDFLEADLTLVRDLAAGRLL